MRTAGGRRGDLPALRSRLRQAAGTAACPCRPLLAPGPEAQALAAAGALARPAGPRAGAPPGPGLAGRRRRLRVAHPGKRRLDHGLPGQGRTPEAATAAPAPALPAEVPAADIAPSPAGDERRPARRRLAVPIASAPTRSGSAAPARPHGPAEVQAMLDLVSRYPEEEGLRPWPKACSSRRPTAFARTRRHAEAALLLRRAVSLKPDSRPARASLLSVRWKPRTGRGPRRRPARSSPCPRRRVAACAASATRSCARTATGRRRRRLRASLEVEDDAVARRTAGPRRERACATRGA